jgi:hypothetical protein
MRDERPVRPIPRNCELYLSVVFRHPPYSSGSTVLYSLFMRCGDLCSAMTQYQGKCQGSRFSCNLGRELPPGEMYTEKMYPLEEYTSEIDVHWIHTFGIHAYAMYTHKMYTSEIHTHKYMSIGYTPVRFTPIRCMLMGWTARVVQQRRRLGRHAERRLDAWHLPLMFTVCICRLYQREDW